MRVGEKGLEPLTSTMSTSRSNQLSYPPRLPRQCSRRNVAPSTSVAGALAGGYPVLGVCTEGRFPEVVRAGYSAGRSRDTTASMTVPASRRARVLSSAA